jgi:TIR domain
MSEPKLFISYCWSSTEHEEWVLQLGTELRENGVDVILDKWDLKEGNDANAFMEKMVTDEDIKKVILVIDEKYSEKANSRTGGVGTETQIISAEVYESVDQNKFVAVIANRDEAGKAKLPVFYKSRIYIDLSDGDLYAKNFEQLLRWVFDKPVNIKPEIGKKPAFLDEESSVSLGTTVAYRRCVDAIRNSKPHAQGALTEYFTLFASNLERFRLEPSAGADDFDQKVVDSIEQFTPFKNELNEIFSALAQYETSVNMPAKIHKFFESLIVYFQKIINVGFHKWDWDNLKFIIQEEFLYCVAIFLKHERFDVVEYLLKQSYYIALDDNCVQNTMRSFGVFRNYLESLNHRKSRLDLRRHSVHADMIKERCVSAVITFEQLMQADFLLYLTEALAALKEGRPQEWWPETLVFKSSYGGVFEIFLRSESSEYFSKVAPLLGISSKADLSQLPQALQEEKIYIPKWQFDEISPLELMNFEKLATRA